MNSRIQIMLDSRHLEEGAAAEGEVAGLWRKAVQTFASSVIPGLDPNAQFTLTYQAALQASMAVLRAAGFRVRGNAHHHHTFAGVAALDLGALSDAARDLNLIRRNRRDAIYDWGNPAGSKARRRNSLGGAAAVCPCRAVAPW